MRTIDELIVLAMVLGGRNSDPVSRASGRCGTPTMRDEIGHNGMSAGSYLFEWVKTFPYYFE